MIINSFFFLKKSFSIIYSKGRCIGWVTIRFSASEIDMPSSNSDRVRYVHFRANPFSLSLADFSCCEVVTSFETA